MTHLQFTFLNPGDIIQHKKDGIFLKITEAKSYCVEGNVLDFDGVTVLNVKTRVISCDAPAWEKINA